MSYCPFRNDPQFKIGDIVRLKNGYSPIVVLNIEAMPRQMGTNWGIGYRYYSDTDDKYGNRHKFRKETDFILYDGNLENYNKENHNMNKYYTTGNSVTKGLFIGTNADGKYVIEWPSGHIEAYNPSECKEVKPYTISVKIKQSFVHYEIEEGKVQKGDILYFLEDDIFVKINAINTQPSTYHTLPKGTRRVLTEEL